MRKRSANHADLIDRASKEIRQDEDKTVYKSLDEIAEDLPDNSPRFVLLSYPMTMVGGCSLYTKDKMATAS